MIQQEVEKRNSSEFCWNGGIVVEIRKQGLFEGTKAYRKENGRVLLFRPEQNAIRMKIGAERMCMASPSIDHFVHALKQTVLANKRWVRKLINCFRFQF